MKQKNYSKKKHSHLGLVNKIQRLAYKWSNTLWYAKSVTNYTGIYSYKLGDSVDFFSDAIFSKSLLRGIRVRRKIHRKEENIS